MTIRKFRIYDGNNISARHEDNSITVYVNNGFGVYKGKVYTESQAKGSQNLFMHCDEVIKTRGGHIEIRGTKLKLVTDN